MSVLQYPQGLNPSDLQIWHNAAFDHGDSEDLGRSCSPGKPLLVKKIAESFESVSTKENRSPLFENSLCAKSPRPTMKPLHPNASLEILKFRDEKKIDKEIEEVENQISQLSSRLEVLRMEKAEKSVKNVEKRGRIVTAKFMEPKQSLKNADERKKIEESLSVNEKAVKFQRRGLSLGPSEILSAVKSPLFGKQGMITPIQPIQNRRKSCFWKLQDIDEVNLSKERLSLSPKSRKSMAKPFPPRQAVTTVSSKKTLKKDEAALSSVQPKKLFRDGEKSIPPANKKPQRPGRIVPSRYNQNTAVPSTMRKRSLPENDKDDTKRCDKKRSLSVGKFLSEMKNPGSEIRVKKRWEIPEEIVLHRGSEESEKSPETTSVVPDMLPRIKTGRGVKESPRDSGPAKRVAELVGRKSFFSNDEDDQIAVCQALRFADTDA